jgi:type II secretion system protein G
MLSINNHMKKTTSRLGFTLIEILVVMVIIGILSAIGLGSFTASQQKARDSQRKGNLKSIANALEVYYNDWGQYPQSDSGMIVGCGDPASPSACEWLKPFENSNGTIYMVELPGEPLSSGAYHYVAADDGRSYQLYARLENLRDKDVPKDGTTPLVYSGTGCGSGRLCNFGVASTNSTLAETVVEGQGQGSKGDDPPLVGGEPDDPSLPVDPIGPPAY